MSNDTNKPGGTTVTFGNVTLENVVSRRPVATPEELERLNGNRPKWMPPAGDDLRAGSPYRYLLEHGKPMGEAELIEWHRKTMPPMTEEQIEMLPMILKALEGYRGDPNFSLPREMLPSTNLARPATSDIGENEIGPLVERAAGRRDEAPPSSTTSVKLGNQRIEGLNPDDLAAMRGAIGGLPQNPTAEHTGEKPLSNLAVLADKGGKFIC